MTRRVPPSFDLKVLSLSKSSPFTINLSVPETVKEIREFLIESLKIVRDWQYSKQKQRIDIERERLAIDGLKEDLDFKREPNRLRLDQARMQLEFDGSFDVRGGHEGLSLLETTSPKLLEENAQASSTEAILESTDDSTKQQTGTDTNNDPTTSVSRAPQVRSKDEAFQQLRRDMARTAASPVQVVSLKPIDE